MVYQVLARASAQAAWEPFQAMTRDPLQAMNLVKLAARDYAEVSVIQAETAALLREQVRLLRVGEPSGHEACPLPSLTATPRISVMGANPESQRWLIEQGPGGDHDMPYRFETNVSAQTLTRWSQLMTNARTRPSAPMTQPEVCDALPGEVDHGVNTTDTMAVDADSLPTERIG